jgi:CrcB protein
MPADHGRPGPGPGPRPDRFAYHDGRLPVDPDLRPDDPGEPSSTHHPTVHARRSRQAGVLAAIAAGGFIGTLGRYEMGLAWKPHPGGVPWATFTVNTSGAFLLGLVLTMLLERLGPTRYVRPFLCVGVLGAWTTMSTFAVESDLLLKADHVVTALGYTGATVVTGLLAAWLGMVLARAFDVKRLSWSSR